MRTITLPDGRKATVYVVRKKGPRGGKTVLGEIRKPSSKKRSK